MTAKQRAEVKMDRELIRYGETAERYRIRNAQRHALRNLAVLIGPDVECASAQGPKGCTSRKHMDDCARCVFLESMKALRAATKEPR